MNDPIFILYTATKHAGKEEQILQGVFTTKTLAIAVIKGNWRGLAQQDIDSLYKINRTTSRSLNFIIEEAEINTLLP